MSGAGGAIYSNGSADIANNTFWSNTSGWGGAIWSKGLGSVIRNCTFAKNSDLHVGVLGVENQLTVANCIFWDVDSPAEIFLDWGALTVVHSDVRGGYAGAGNIDGDPRFVNSATGDLRLRPDSPCIDAADGSLAPAADFDGAPA